MNRKMMTEGQIQELDPKLRLKEILADLEHRQWAHWTKYMLDNLTPENIERWRKQIDTDYIDLTEKEKDSDRKWVLRIFTLVQEETNRQINEMRLDGKV